MAGWFTLARDFVPLALMVRLAAAAAALASAARPRRSRRWGFAGSIVASLLVGATGASVALSGVPAQGVLLGHAASGLSFRYAVVRGLFAIAPGPGHFDHLAPLLVALPLLAAAGLAGALFAGTGYAVRRAATWGCGGELTARTEYTATAFSKPLMLIFAAIYRPTREVSRVEEVSPYFPSEVRYRAAIEPTFERFVYGPLTRGVLGAAERLKVIQAGSLHAYLAYVLFLGIALLLWLGGGR